ncbi:GH25 family lysozyme [Mucilaginibacter sp.]|uniref:GH25 family lysozyme n=1 Tax=Mucilaginibacter sp. TaxID=1882438 RepID=UPI0032648896
MKKIFWGSLLTVALFTLINNAFAQQCLSGGCTVFNNQYPSSGAPYTPPSSWQVLSNPATGGQALMNAGNYTLFNVISGNTYEWSYCETYGGVSISWDAQLTLFNNTNLATPICFSTDFCGNAPYISWKATFTGTVRLLSTLYSNGSGCKNNAGSASYNKLVYRQLTASSCPTTTTPISASAIPTGKNSADLSWIPGSTAGTSTTYYWVVGTSPDVTFGNGIAQKSTPNNSASVSGLNCDSKYYLRVFTKNDCDGTSSSYRTSNSFTTPPCSTTNLIYGIDVSHWQEKIKWADVYANGSGKVFAFAKATEGISVSTDDKTFKTNITQGKAVGVIMGAYHIGHPENGNSATAEANHFLDSAISYIGAGNLPPALDLEPQLVTSLTKSELSNWVQEWMTVVQNKTGIAPIIYTTGTVVQNNLNSSLNKYKLWIATYGKTGPSNPLTPPPNLGVWTTWAFNQYSQTETHVPGVSTVDLDVFNGDRAAFDDLIGTNALKSDLTITANTQLVSPTTVNAGGNIKVECSEDNNGPVSIGANDVTIYLSKDDKLIKGEDIYLGRISFPGLAPNSNSPYYSNTVTIPVGTKAGKYYVYFWADGTEIIPESDDDNNFRSRIITVTEVKGCSTPAPPSINLPTNISSTGFTATWSKSSDATSYRVDVSPDLEFKTFVTGYNNLNVGNTTSIEISGLSCNTIYSYRVRSYNDCGPSTNIVGYIVNTLACCTPPSKPTITASGPLEFCQGGSVKLSASTCSGCTFKWSPGNQTTQSLTVTQPGDYSVTVSNGCSPSATSSQTTVSVNPMVSPDVKISASTPTTICLGQSVTFTAAPTNGGTAPTYQWKIGNSNVGTGKTFTSSSITNGQVVSCIMTSNAPCLNAATATSNAITMSVNSTSATPKVEIAITSGSNPTCAGQPVTFTATSTNGGTNPIYQWSVGGVNVVTGISYSPSTLANGQIVSCVMTANLPCGQTTTTSNSITMSVGASVVPTVQIAISSGSNPSCSNQTLSFAATPTNGGTNPSYQWKVGNINVGTGQTYTSTNLTNGQIVSCLMTSSLPCVNASATTSNAITIIVSPPPSAVITANGSTSLPQGGSVLLKASTGSGYTYQWLLNGSTIANATNANYTVTTGGSYTVQVIANGCSTTSGAILVTSAFNLPTNNFIVTGTGESCKTSNNGSINITAAQTLNYSVEITNTGARYAFTKSTTIENLSAGTYSICITVENNRDYKACFTVVITEPNDLAVYVAVNTPNKTVKLNLGGGTLYQIELNGIQYATSKPEITLPVISGNNQLKITADKLCQGVFQQSFTVDDGIVIFPNPFAQSLSINLGLDKSPLVGVEIRNVSGKIIYAKEVKNKTGIIVLNDLPEMTIGVYVIKLKLATTESIHKILKQ